MYRSLRAANVRFCMTERKISRKNMQEGFKEMKQVTITVFFFEILWNCLDSEFSEKTVSADCGWLSWFFDECTLCIRRERTRLFKWTSGTKYILAQKISINSFWNLEYINLFNLLSLKCQQLMLAFYVETFGDWFEGISMHDHNRSHYGGKIMRISSYKWIFFFNLGPSEWPMKWRCTNQNFWEISMTKDIDLLIVMIHPVDECSFFYVLSITANLNLGCYHSKL